MLIRTATTADAPGIAHIHVATWREAYRGQMPEAVLAALDVARRTVFWLERISRMQGTVFVAEEGADIVGFCDLVSSRDKDADPGAVAEIVAVYILPQHWRKGAGRALCDRALEEARENDYQVVTLWVLASNAAAHHFYAAMGFEFDGATKSDRTPDGSELQELRFRITL